MTRCIIHIGMHKTGSTSIQHSLDGFRNDRFAYAKLDVPNQSLAMYSLFAQSPERHHIHVAHGRDAATVADYAARMRAALEKSIVDADRRTLLISGEDISALSEEGLVRMRDYFRPRFDETIIVGYIRPPAGYMASGFQQRAKAGAVANLRFDREYRSYRDRFAKFDEIFGRSNVLLRKFDPAAFPGGCVVRDFCSPLGIDFPERRIIRLNESLPRQVISLLYTYRKFGPKFGFNVVRAPEGERLGALLVDLGNDKFRFSPDAINPVLRNNRADIQWMEDRLGQSLEENIGGHQPGDIYEEADLLTPDAVAVGKLLGLLGRAAPAGVKGETPEEVALLVHAFRKKHAKSGAVLEHRDDAARAKPASAARETGAEATAPIRPAGLVEALRRENPRLLEGIPEDKAATLIRNVFHRINDTLMAAGEGEIGFRGLGRFHVRKVKREVAGKKVMVTRIGFSLSEPRAIRTPEKKED